MSCLVYEKSEVLTEEIIQLDSAINGLALILNDKDADVLIRSSRRDGGYHALVSLIDCEVLLVHLHKNLTKKRNRLQSERALP